MNTLFEQDSFVNVAGTVQFECKRDILDGQFDQWTIKPLNSQELVGINFWKADWPELPEFEIGDLIVVDGRYKSKVSQTRDGSAKTYHSVNAYRVGTIAFDVTFEKNGAPAPIKGTTAKKQAAKVKGADAF